jgi:site-specific DNA recombinase
MSTWAAVVRVSHMGDRKAGSDTFHADREQLEAIHAWAKARDVRLDVMQPELGVSGGLPLERRPSLLRAIEGVERGEYAGIVVAYLSRLGRNVAEQLRAWDRVQAADGEIVTIREGIDTSTASGRLHRNLLISVDAHEREQHAERFEERRRLATEAGIWQRRQTPRGYRRDGVTRKLVPDRNAESVRSAFSGFVAGAKIVELSDRLRMTPSGVRALLRNRVYLGELRVGKHVNTVAHPAIVDVETFEAVQHRLANGVRPARTRGGAPALLAGLVRCSSCGHLMTRGNSDGQATYTCPHYHSGERCPAPSSVMARRLDSHVERLALDELGRLDWTAAASDRAEGARRKLAEAERALDAYLDAVSPDDVGATAFNRAARKKREAVDDAREALQAELSRTPGLPNIGTGREVWPDLNAHERNTLLRGLLAAVVVRPVGRGRQVAVADRARVLKYGTPVHLPPRRGGQASGIVPIPFPDTDGVGVLRVPTVEDGLEDGRGSD